MNFMLIKADFFAEILLWDYFSIKGSFGGVLRSDISQNFGFFELVTG